MKMFSWSAALIGGLFTGIATVFLLVIGIVVTASFTGAAAGSRLFFAATVESENGLPAVVFTPNFEGMSTVVAIIMLATIVVFIRRTRRRQ